MLAESRAHARPRLVRARRVPVEAHDLAIRRWIVHPLSAMQRQWFGGYLARPGGARLGSRPVCQAPNPARWASSQSAPRLEKAGAGFGVLLLGISETMMLDIVGLTRLAV
jgi:hypothetical protein